MNVREHNHGEVLGGGGGRAVGGGAAPEEQVDTYQPKKKYTAGKF
jgi:hypothetical protein